MKYVGSKNRLAKDLVPIIQPYVDNSVGYLEPFVGGGNLIDKIKSNNKYGSDINKYLIALLQKVQTDISDIPDHISEQEYIKVKNNKNNYEDWYIGLVGFVLHLVLSGLAVMQEDLRLMVLPQEIYQMRLLET